MDSLVKYIIFTDASQRQSSVTGRRYTSYAVAILNIETKQYVTFDGELSDRSVVFAEGWAIYQGLIRVANIIRNNISNGKKSVGVLIATDSKLNVETLTWYIPYAWDLSSWKNWRKRDGTPVKNQDLYRKIVTFLRTHHEVDLRITHVNSHLTEDKWPTTQKKLEKYGVHVDSETAKVFISMNWLVDRLAQNLSTKAMVREETNGKYLRLRRRENDR